MHDHTAVLRVRVLRELSVTCKSNHSALPFFICVVQELITQWMAVQEQWVRLAPAFVPPDLDVGVPAHERVRFTDVSGCVVGFHAGNGKGQMLSTLLGV